MTRLLDGFLHVVRRSRFIARFQRVDMNRVWEEVMKDLQDEIVLVNAQVSVVQRLPQCKADPELMATVCKILLENALKFRHPDRPCKIQIAGEKEYSRCVYSIQDNGIGFEMKHAQNLFSLFYQIRPHSSDTGIGTGLAMAKQALARMGGGIQADGSTENGALFSFWLPR